MDIYKSRSKVKAVGILNGVLTLALLVQILSCTVYPLWVKYHLKRSSQQQQQQQNSNKGDYNLKQIYVLPEDVSGIDNLFSKFPNFVNVYDKEKLGSGWLWAFTGLVVLFGLVSLLGVAALLWSTSESIDNEMASQMNKVWMYCHMFTSFLSVVELGCVYLMPHFDIWIGAPIPTLLYFGFQGVITWLVVEQLTLMTPMVAFKFDEKIVVEGEVIFANKAIQLQRIKEFCLKSRPNEPPVLSLRLSFCSGDLAIAECCLNGVWEWHTQE